MEKQHRMQGLKVNIGKAKVRKTGKKEGSVFASGNYLYIVCEKGVGRNSVNCSFYKHWIHKRCSGFKGKPTDAPDFK